MTACLSPLTCHVGFWVSGSRRCVGKPQQHLVPRRLTRGVSRGAGGPRFSLPPRSWPLGLQPPCRCFLIIFRPVPVSDNCIYFSKIVCSDRKGNSFLFYPSQLPWEGGGVVNSKELFALHVTLRREVFSSEGPFVSPWSVCLGTF